MSAGLFMMTHLIRTVRPLGFPWQTQDPFLFCVHHLDHYPKGNELMGPAASLAGRNLGQDFAPNQQGWRMYHGQHVPGFPAHPHRGFETVTVVTQGLVDHSDSLGAAGRFGFGDVQWMTAGKGVQHCEMFPLLQREQENPLELFQIWLNLPRAKKFATPHFAMLWADTIPMITHTDVQGKKTTIRVIAGKADGHEAPAPAPESWAADPSHEVAIQVIRMEASAVWELAPASPGVNRSIFFYQGQQVSLGGKTFDQHVAIELEPHLPATIVNGDAESFLLLLQGKPIAEPVVQYGPFVMNSQAEIQQAMTEYRQTEFGGWPWPSHEHVHPREKSRFARYPDGTEEFRP